MWHARRDAQSPALGLAGAAVSRRRGRRASQLAELCRCGARDVQRPAAGGADRHRPARGVAGPKPPGGRAQGAKGQSDHGGPVDPGGAVARAAQPRRSAAAAADLDLQWRRADAAPAARLSRCPPGGHADQPVRLDGSDGGRNLGIVSAAPCAAQRSGPDRDQHGRGRAGRARQRRSPGGRWRGRRAVCRRPGAGAGLPSAAARGSAALPARPARL